MLNNTLIARGIAVIICFGCMACSSVFLTDKNSDGKYCFIYFTCEYENKQEWKDFDEALKSNRNAVAPLPIYIKGEDVCVSNGVICNHINDSRVDVHIEMITNDYGRALTCCHESLRYGKFRFDIFCNGKGCPIVLSVHKYKGGCFSKVSSYDWPWWRNVDICVYDDDLWSVGEDSCSNFIAYFRLLGDVDEL